MALSTTLSKDVDNYISNKDKNRIEVKVEEVEADEVLADPNLVAHLVLPGKSSTQY